MKGRRRVIRFLRDCDGAAAVEFALVAGPLLLLFVGIIEVGRLMWSGHALDEVAISGARCVGLHTPGCATGEAVVPDMAIAHIIAAANSWGLALESGDISLDTSVGCAVETGFLRVALTYSFESVLPGLAGTELDSEACFPSQF